MRNLALMWVLAGVVSFAAVQADSVNSDSYNRSGLKSLERIYHILLKRWHDGADGRGQGGAVDSVVLDIMKKTISFENEDINFRDTIKNSMRMLKVREDLQRYRGLGIFLKDDNFTSTNANVLKEYYNIDIKDLKSYGSLDMGIEYFYGHPYYWVVCVRELPDGEQVFYLISTMTCEVLSTYKEKIKKVPQKSINERRK